MISRSFLADDLAHLNENFLKDKNGRLAVRCRIKAVG
jgi:hypothetical protein